MQRWRSGMDFRYIETESLLKFGALKSVAKVRLFSLVRLLFLFFVSNRFCYGGSIKLSVSSEGLQ